jgi:hypothetical protein
VIGCGAMRGVDAPTHSSPTSPSAIDSASWGRLIVISPNAASGSRSHRVRACAPYHTTPQQWKDEREECVSDGCSFVKAKQVQLFILAPLCSRLRARACVCVCRVPKTTSLGTIRMHERPRKCGKQCKKGCTHISTVHKPANLLRFAVNARARRDVVA